MTRYVALLRGINVGGNKRIAMADLQALCEGLGFEHVRTLLQSGNVVLDASCRRRTVESRLSGAIEQQLGMEVRVVVRTAAELAAVVEHDPYSSIADPLKYYSVSFLASEPAPRRLRISTRRSMRPSNSSCTAVSSTCGGLRVRSTAAWSRS